MSSRCHCDNKSKKSTCCDAIAIAGGESARKGSDIVARVITQPYNADLELLATNCPLEAIERSNIYNAFLARIGDIGNNVFTELTNCRCQRCCAATAAAAGNFQTALYDYATIAYASPFQIPTCQTTVEVGSSGITGSLCTPGASGASGTTTIMIPGLESVLFTMLETSFNMAYATLFNISGCNYVQLPAALPVNNPISCAMTPVPCAAAM
jgi:hypothetical protein